MLDEAVVRSELFVLFAAFALAQGAGCSHSDHESGPSSRSAASASSQSAVASPSAAPRSSAASAVASATPTKAEPSCPEGMAPIPGGEFWVGSEPSEHFSSDESPRFLTQLAPFCLDLTEVTARDYAQCVERGACRPASTRRVLCNAGHADRADHPINCVTYALAETYCTSRGARLPSEPEWEYAARGGDRYLLYPWGEGSPDGRACWKHNGTCPVKTFAAGAFGLFDISGNVWEWTDSWYGAYPWPLERGFAKVYRGGSFSRRFEKWMHTRLRDRARPEEAGSHLGFRCALTPKGVECPFGGADGGRCLQGVLGRSCDPAESWNGARCAPPGAPRCRPGRVEKRGFGCVLAQEAAPQTRDLEAEAKSVARTRSAEFDDDCRHNQRDRPRAFRYAGGSHEARNLVSRRDGCKNRDVGVGWNSTCCP
jgi:formylglycine-generating enzyme required for sulfatase activity